MPVSHTRVFISFATPNKPFVDQLVERLRDHYIKTWYAPRNMPGGYFAENIRQALNECDWFIIVLSKAAIESKWVKTELDLAIADPRFYNQIIPIMAEPCNWETMHENLGKYQIFDFVKYPPKEAEARLLQHLGVTPHQYPPVMVGDVKIPVYIFVGGDGKTRFRAGDILCDGPGQPTDETRTYNPPKEIKEFAANYIPQREDECRKQGKIFINNRQVRLSNVSWGSSTKKGGLQNLPLHLKLGWTWYYHTATTNLKTDERLPNGLTIGQKYAAPIDNLHDCKLSNPIATNLSVVTSDNFIFFGQRSHNVQGLPGGYQPAVSGDGQSEDVDANGIYDPFATAIRESIEECIGNVYQPTKDEVTFFGLGRWMKTRFPFLFGEIRLKNLTAKQLESMRPTNEWEGIRLKLPFNIEAVTEWVAQRYRDQYFGREGWPVSAPIFSLLQSLMYEYPNRWIEVINRLDFPDISTQKN
jgi:hypothetical protein